jgi:hypothetical protein
LTTSFRRVIKDENQYNAIIAEAEAQQASGDKFGAEETDLAIDIQKYRELLKNVKDLTQAEKDAKVADFSSRGEANIEFNRLDKKGSQGMASMQQDITDVQNQAAGGQITQLSATAQILSIEQQRLPVLMEIAQAQLAAAQASGNEDAIAKAQQYIQTLKGVKTTMVDATTAQTYFFNQLETQGAQALQTFFTSWIDGSKSFKDSLADLAKAFEDMVATMIAKLLVLMLFEAILGWIDPSGASTSAFEKLSGMGSHKAGGFTANVPVDQVAGIVHGNEWVATAEQTKKYRSLFEAIGSGKPLPLSGAGTMTASAALPKNTVSAAMLIAPASNAEDGQGTGGVSSGAPIVQVINNTGQPSQQRQTTGAGGQSITQIIIGAVRTDIASGGAIAKTIEGQYGVNRTGTRRG